MQGPAFADRPRRSDFFQSQFLRVMVMDVLHHELKPRLPGSRKSAVCLPALGLKMVGKNFPQLPEELYGVQFLFRILPTLQFINRGQNFENFILPFHLRAENLIRSGAEHLVHIGIVQQAARNGEQGRRKDDVGYDYPVRGFITMKRPAGSSILSEPT